MRFLTRLVCFVMPVIPIIASAEEISCERADQIAEVKSVNHGTKTVSKTWEIDYGDGMQECKHLTSSIIPTIQPLVPDFNLYEKVMKYRYVFRCGNKFFNGDASYGPNAIISKKGELYGLGGWENVERQQKCFLHPDKIVVNERVSTRRNYVSASNYLTFFENTIISYPFKSTNF